MIAGASSANAYMRLRAALLRRLRTGGLRGICGVVVAIDGFRSGPAGRRARFARHAPPVSVPWVLPQTVNLALELVERGVLVLALQEHGQRSLDDEVAEAR